MSEPRPGLPAISRTTSKGPLTAPFFAFAANCAGRGPFSFFGRDPLRWTRGRGENGFEYGLLRRTKEITVREDGYFFYRPSGTLQMRGQICSLTIRQNVEVLLAYLNKLHNERPQPRRRKRQAHMVKIPQYQRLPDNAPKVT